jgi:branched-chain amino acid transport system substrate-binding protein
MKNQKIVIGLASIVFAFVGCISCNQPTKSDLVKIGAILPLTGKAAQYGVYFKQGSELALSDAIEDSLIKPEQVQLLIEDGKADAAISLTAFKKLVETDKISSCLVDLSNVILAIKPVANQDSIVSINSSSFSSEIEDGNDFMFSVLPNAKQYGSYIGNYCFNDLKYKNAGVLFRNDAMGTSLNENFRNSFKELGGAVVFEESHAVGETDYKVIIQKIRNKKVDMILVASYGPEIASFAKQCKEANYNVQIVTYQGFFIKSALDVAGEAANGIICIASAFDPSSTDSKVIELKEKLKTRFNTDDLNYYLAAHYDGTKILLEAIAQGNKTGSEIRNYLITTKTFTGLTGTITFDEYGLASIPLKPFKVKGGKFISF